MLTFAVLGLGNRGSVYSNNLIKHAEAKIVAVCDVSEASLRQARELYGVSENSLFLSEERFFSEKRADVLIIATLDALHCRQTVRALELGYDVLLEKPIAPDMEECELIYEAAQKYGGNVVICHNLRYTPFYQKLKTLIADGLIGEVLSVEQAENVAYHHYMCSFIRGKWHDSKQTSPIILAKCCHDLDIISWLANKNENTVESFGTLGFYNPKHKPEGAANRCLDCKYKQCIYNAYEFFVNAPGCLCVPYGFDPTPENIAAYLREKDNLYGECVFNGINDVCDRQSVFIGMNDDVTASLLMHGFSVYETYRITRVFGTKGEICGRLEDGLLRVRLFDGSDYVVDVNPEIDGTSEHSGGDAGLVNEYLDFLKTGIRPLGISKLEDSLQSHRLAFAAESNRLEKSYDFYDADGTFIPSGLSGIYSSVASYAAGGVKNTVQAISMTVNYGVDCFKQRVSSDLAFVRAIVGAEAVYCTVDLSNKGYIHGFINVFFANGAILRYGLTCSPLSNRTEISVFAPSANIYADSEKAIVVTRTGGLFDQPQEVKCKEDSACRCVLSDEVIAEALKKSSIFTK